MKEGELIELEVNGARGMWEKIAAPGIKALGETRSMWHRLRSERQGGITSVETCD